jgi:hypothetical protein
MRPASLQKLCVFLFKGKFPARLFIGWILQDRMGFCYFFKNLLFAPFFKGRYLMAASRVKRHLNVRATGRANGLDKPTVYAGLNSEFSLLFV